MGVNAPIQALVKARGDGLGFDLSKAEFHFEDGIRSDTASVWIDGQQQTRWEPCMKMMTLLAVQANLSLFPGAPHFSMVWHCSEGFSSCSA